MESPLFSRAGYQFNSRKNKQDRVDIVNETVEGTGFKIRPKLSTREIQVYQSGNDYHISGPGTDLHGDSRKQDIQDDIQILFGSQEQSNHFRLRRNRIKKDIRAILKENPNAQINLSGHSLAGSVMINALNDKFINDNVNQVHTYNVGSSPIFDTPFTGNATKITNHLVRGDPISSGKIPGKKVFQKPLPGTQLNNAVVSAVSEIVLPNSIAEVLGNLTLHSLDHFL